MTEALAPDPNVLRVDLVGSRACGEATELSDWDFHIQTERAAELARRLPAILTTLEPLAAQSDRLTERATYMLMLSGAIKVDLLPGDERRALEPPWEPTPSNLVAIDAHFWDWTVWLGGKVSQEGPTSSPRSSARCDGSCSVCSVSPHHRRRSKKPSLHTNSPAYS